MSLLAVTGAFGLLYLGISANINRLRLRHRIPYGTGDMPELLRATRTQANFAEFVPFILLLMWVMQIVGVASEERLTVLAGGFFIIRCLHAYGLLVDEPRHKRYGFRMFAAASTYLILLYCSAALLLQGLMG